MGDLISRNEVLEAWDNYNIGGHKMFIDIINNIPKANTEWIPCNERLPQINDEILCILKTGKMFVGKYREPDRYKNHPYFDWNQNGFPNVVAWMPLPKQYIIL